MATKTYYFEGECEWAKVHEAQKDKKYNRYSINVFLDDPSWERFEESGMQIKTRENKDGRKFVQFHRQHEKLIKGELADFGPPQVFSKGTEPDERLEAEIGNGSHVTVKVVVYDSIKGKGHRLEAVRVNDLVEYKRDDGIDAPW